MSFFTRHRKATKPTLDPEYANEISSLDILSLFGEHGLLRWQEAGCPIVTPDTFRLRVGLPEPEAVAAR